MTFRAITAALFALALLAGPATADTKKPAGSTTTKTTTATAPVKGAPTMPLPDGISEEEFKALHTLSSEKPPAPLGENVQVGGATCYLSLPKGAKAPMPGVVVIHEWWGLNDHIKHWADRLAAEGYAALAVDLYGGKVATTPDAAMEAMKAVDAAAARAVLLAASDFLEKDPRVKAPRTASIGWCFGGGQSLQLALADPDLDAAVIYYGHLETDPAALRKIHAKILGVFGSQDKSIPPDAVNAFDAALKEAGIEREIHSYDAPHAFANPSSGAYTGEAAASAWERVRAFLARNLRAEG